jgi:hypothetical protein
MSRAQRSAGVFVAASILAAAFATPARAQAPPDTRPPCVRTLVAMEDTLDSSKAKGGEVFKFRLVEPASAADGTLVPAGTLGYGIVSNVQHADRGGRPGYLAVETRFFVLGNGKHVAAIIDWATDAGSTAVGSTANAPYLLGLIPLVGYAVGGYDAMHHGKDATIPRGTRLAVFIGDDAALGACRPLAAGELPQPTPPPVPPAMPVATAAPAPQAPTASPTTRP